jgi:hypothetical protein
MLPVADYYLEEIPKMAKAHFPWRCWGGSS